MNLQSFKSKVAAIAGLIALGAIGSWMNRGSNTGALRAADSGPAVTIAGPLPVPVTGTVGLSGTPNVNVANTPTVNLAAGNGIGLAPGTTVGLTPGTSVLAINPDEFGRSPYQENQFVFLSNAPLAPPAGLTCDSTVCLLTVFFNQALTRKRLVIKHVSVDLVLTAGATIGPAELNTTTSTPQTSGPVGETFFTLAPTSLVSSAFVGPTFGHWVANEPVDSYVDPGGTPVLNLRFDAAHLPPSSCGPNCTTGSNCTFALSGYYVSLP